MEAIMTYIDAVLTARLDQEFGKTEVLKKPTINVVLEKKGPLAQLIEEYNLQNQDMLILFLALLPYIAPQYLSTKIGQYIPKGGELPEFGGMRGKSHRGIIPTGETLLYVLAGTDPTLRAKYIPLFTHSILFRKGILSIGAAAEEEPFLAGPLKIDREITERILFGGIQRPTFNSHFPAQLIETELNWRDLVLPEKTLEQIREIEHWLQYHERLMAEWGLGRAVKPGYRVMFFGPPGTGKTLTAGLLGKHTGRDVFRIDLSLVVSKYIGETEKQLSQLFDKAANKDWILFFDEADALFGKRTSVRDAHDKYANQEVSYLLQRVESHPGLVILASNFKSNIDTAFLRRFQTVVDFEMPSYKERYALWNNNLPRTIPWEQGLEIEELARRFTLSGANIVNIIQQVGLKTLAAGDTEIKKDQIIQAIKNELSKEGKMH
ncbi:Cell division protein FtsH [Lunatimonas lonarensis]|uniref:Cell division protein FtsH n=1 Tax=Lunatimonas lonarensis TaxID=1232681 RepID=R7ZW57_9BACT|nr:ATP-binding protein [Lunatimonas lonarensis]EON78229.1 Cell division protein FtsH [Lunatimonas lonarensis]